MPRYQIGPQLRQIEALLGVSPERVLRRIGLSATLARQADVRVGGEAFLQVWDAMCAEANRPRIEMDLALAYAHGPFVPPIFAFSCADTLALGLTRLAKFKPLVGPVTLDVSRSEGALRIALRPSVPNTKFSPSLGLFELLYVTECARTFTGVSVMPVAACLPGPLSIDDACLAHLGLHPTVSDHVGLTFSEADAERPLITRSAALWDSLEPGFLQELQAQSGMSSVSVRLRAALAEALPGGAASVADMARRLNLSKRSLQRKLSDEGTTFQTLLTQTRSDLAIRYLTESDLSLPEIAALLGFRDGSSFFRAFQTWTGQTPSAYRTGHRALDAATGVAHLEQG